MTVQGSNSNNTVLEVGGQIPLRIRGILGVLLLVILLLGGAVIWLVQFSLGKWGQPFDIHGTLKSHSEIVAEQHAEGTYVLSVCLNPARRPECERINLQMPDSLRKKQRQE